MGRIKSSGCVVYGSECPLMSAHSHSCPRDLDFVTCGHKRTQAGTKVIGGHEGCEQVQRVLVCVNNMSKYR